LGNNRKFFTCVLKQTKVLEGYNWSTIFLMVFFMSTDANPIQFVSDSVFYWFTSHTANTDNSVKIPAPYSSHAATLSKPSTAVGVALMSAFVNENSHLSPHAVRRIIVHDTNFVNVNL